MSWGGKKEKSKKRCEMSPVIATRLKRATKEAQGGRKRKKDRDNVPEFLRKEKKLAHKRRKSRKSGIHIEVGKQVGHLTDLAKAGIKWPKA